MRSPHLLVDAGAKLAHVYFPHNGLICLVVCLADGHTIDVAMVGRETFLGPWPLNADNAASQGAAVAMSGTASRIDVEQFRLAADRSADFRQLLRPHERALLVQAQQSAACNAVHSVELRLARWLAHARDYSGSDTLALTQDFVARMLGVQRNAVTIAANALQHAGLIVCTRGHIEIVDPRGLIANACECYGEVTSRCDHLLRQHPKPN